MATKVEIWNTALSHLGIEKEIAGVDERSAEAAACRRFYDPTVDQLLRAFAWSFATRFATLALVEADPTSEWSYSYRYPSDCLLVRRILSGLRNDTPDTRIEYRITSDASGLLIYTDQADAEVEFTVLANDPLRYPSDFTSALSLLLAAKMAPRLTSGDPYKLRERNLNLFLAEIAEAKSASINEQQVPVEPDASWIRERE